MPSPIGHALGALIVSGGGGAPRWSWLVLALVGIAPDLDLLWGRHSMETHSIGAAVIAGSLALLFTRDRRMAVLVTLVWFAHPLMDAIGEDSSAPFGVMLWWPFSHAHVIAPFTVFDSIYRVYWKFDFWSHNVLAAAREILILGPILAVVWFWRRRMRQENR